MLQKMYSIHDQKSGIFHAPFFQTTERDALGYFKHLVNDENTTLHRYPEDFDLYCVGEYDNNTGKTLPEPTPQHIAKAIQFRSEKPGPELV